MFNHTGSFLCSLASCLSCLQMKTPPVSITIPLQEFLCILFRDDHFVEIDKTTAEILEHLCVGRKLIHIQRITHEGKELPSPLCWIYSRWKSDSDSWLAAKERSRCEREQRFCDTENIKRIAYSISCEFNLPIEAACIIARKKLQRLDNDKLIEHLAVKIVKNVSEI